MSRSTVILGIWLMMWLAQSYIIIQVKVTSRGPSSSWAVWVINQWALQWISKHHTHGRAHRRRRWEWEPHVSRKDPITSVTFFQPIRDLRAHFSVLPSHNNLRASAYEGVDHKPTVVTFGKCPGELAPPTLKRDGYHPAVGSSLPYLVRGNIAQPLGPNTF